MEIISQKKSDVELAKAYVQLYQRALDRKINFDLSFKRFKELKRTKYCYYSKILLTHEKTPCSTTLTLDRMDNSKGYIDSNVVACSYEINSRKNNLTLNDLSNIIKGLKQKKLL